MIRIDASTANTVLASNVFSIGASAAIASHIVDDTPPCGATPHIACHSVAYL